MYSLNGKLALITGAASGIGLATAHLFAIQGADLILVDLSDHVHEVVKQISEKLALLKLNTRAVGYVCDVTDSAQVNNLFSEVKKIFADYKVPSIIVNSAGIGKKSLLINMSEEEFNKIMSVNVKGTFLVTQAAVKTLVEEFPNAKFDNNIQSYGSIINLSSQAGRRGAAGISHYSASKSALEGFTKAIAKELGKYRIRVNAIMPFFIDTPIISSLTSTERDMLVGFTALGRFGKPEEVADLILFLASNSSTYITGSCIDIHGGY